jgi:hypothetical protein
VYPKGLAAKIARETGSPVLTTSAETVAELSTERVAEVTKSGEEQPLEEAFIAPEPEPAVAEVAEVTTPEPAAAAEPEQAPGELPATASPIFAIGLAGALAAASGMFLRRFTTRRS